MSTDTIPRSHLTFNPYTNAQGRAYDVHTDQGSVREYTRLGSIVKSPEDGEWEFRMSKSEDSPPLKEQDAYRLARALSALRRGKLP